MVGGGVVSAAAVEARLLPVTVMNEPGRRFALPSARIDHWGDAGQRVGAGGRERNDAEPGKRDGVSGGAGRVR